MKCGLGSEWVTPANSFFFHQRDLELWDIHDDPSFPNSLSFKRPRFFHYSVPYAEYSHFIFLGKILESSLYSKRPQFHTIPCKFRGKQNACSVGLYFFGGRKEYASTILSTKAPNSIKNFLSASSISSTMQDKQLQ